MSDVEGPASGGILGHLDYMCSVVQHSIQAALGAEQCHGQKLSQALKVSGTFCETVCAQLMISRLSPVFVFCGQCCS